MTAVLTERGNLDRQTVMESASEEDGGPQAEERGLRRKGGRASPLLPDLWPPDLERMSAAREQGAQGGGLQGPGRCDCTEAVWSPCPSRAAQGTWEFRPHLPRPGHQRALLWLHPALPMEKLRGPKGQAGVRDKGRKPRAPSSGQSPNLETAF